MVRQTYLLGQGMAVRPVFLQQSRVGKEAADERIQDRFGIVADAFLPIAESETLDTLAELLARVENRLDRLERDKVVHAPRLALVLAVEFFVRAEDVEQHHVVAGAVDKLLPCCGGLFARRGRVDDELVSRPEERDEVDDLARAAFGEGREENAGVDGLERELRHLAAERCDPALLVKRLEAVQGQEGADDCVLEGQ